jgi:hypothetical protein
VIPSPISYYAGGVRSASARMPINGLFVDPNARTPYVYVYNFGIQWEPANHYAVELDYVGNKGTKLLNVRTLNQGIGATAPPFGTSSRNLLRGPGQKSVDLSINKSFRVVEMNTLEFRADFFNIFNFVNFGLPNNNMTVPGTVGRITSTSTGPRVVQCAVKYNF